MYSPNSLPNTRIEVADILRGIAVGGIVILHTLEHSGFYSFPPQAEYNQAVWDVCFFLLSNKMYAIFALLFGLSFFVQFDNQAQRGTEDFRYRFAWRMLLLFVIGCINCAIYDGDILMIYAIGGILLIPFIKAEIRVLYAVALLLFLQPVELTYLLWGVADEKAQPLYLEAWRHYVAINPSLESGSFVQACEAGLRHGFLANTESALENGRLTQTFFLFVFGVIIGRKRLFYNENDNIRKWKQIMIVSLIAFIPLLAAFYLLPEKISQPAVSNSVKIILNMWKNLAMVGMIISAVVLLYYQTSCRRALSCIAPYGKMSLTNYMGASLIGAILFYHWGWGQCRYLTHSQSVVLGLGIIIAQYLFCRWWLSTRQRGPLENIWRRATWIRL